MILKEFNVFPFIRNNEYEREDYDGKGRDYYLN